MTGLDCGAQSPVLILILGSRGMLEAGRVKGGLMMWDRVGEVTSLCDYVYYVQALFNGDAYQNGRMDHMGLGTNKGKGRLCVLFLRNRPLRMIFECSNNELRNPQASLGDLTGLIWVRDLCLQRGYSVA